MEIKAQSLRLGYGCSSLMGRISRQQSLSILATAFDVGVNYFDVARSYGYGRAESVLGEFSQGKRDQVVIATKAGFSATPPKLHLTLARSVLQPVVTLFPKLRPLLRRKAAATLVSRPVLTATSLRLSLETSLKELRTDYVDVLLLHEATAAELADDALLGAFSSFISEGKIKQFGVGSDLDKIPDLLKLRTDYLQVLQLENNPGIRAFEAFDLSRVPVVNTHRAVGEIGRKIAAQFELDRQSAALWSEKIGVNLADSHQVSALLLAYSLHQNPKGRVLFSTLNVKHLRENVQVATNLKNYEVSQFKALENLVATLHAT